MYAWTGGSGRVLPLQLQFVAHLLKLLVNIDSTGCADFACNVAPLVLD
jgi:hypothetical protein